MREKAFAYAAKGKAIFPIHSVVDGKCTCSKPECDHAGKHPRTRNGLKDATTDHEQIKKWWSMWPDANIGMLTGQGTLVVDIDLPDGIESLAKLEEQYGSLPPTLEVKTGSGGRHLFFSTDAEMRNSTEKLGKKIDTRCDGGYVILPPSLHESGNRYEWANKEPIAKAPDWLIEKLTRPSEREHTPTTTPGKYGQKALAAELAELTGTGEGSRNHRLNQAAYSLGQLVAGGELDHGQVEAALSSAAASIGLSTQETQQTIKSGLEAGMREPRTAPEQQLKEAPERASEPTEKHDRLRVVKGCDIKPEPIEWLWPGWLAAGKFHVLAGAPGTGKTTIAGSLAATMTNGGKWPDGSKAIKADVALWSGEDDANDTLAPRMIAAGADMSRVHFIQGIDTGQESRPFDPATDMQDLRQYLLKYSEIKLLIVDPVVSAVSGDSHKNTEVRRNLQPLVDLGQECHCAIFGISHFSKGTSGKDPVERVTGSIAFGALARIVLAAAKIEDDSLPEGTRLFARAKSNIGPDSGGWHYRLNTTELREYQGVFTSEVLWGDEVEGSARELLAAADLNDEDGGSALEEAKVFLQGELSLGPVAVKTIMAESRKAGISERTLKRAKAALKIRSEKGGLDSGWQWIIPEITSKDAKYPEEGQQNRVAPFRNVGTLRDEITKKNKHILTLNEDDFIFDEEVI